MTNPSNEIAEVYESLNQSKKRERYDKPLQNIEVGLYGMYLSQMLDVEKQFDKIVNKAGFVFDMQNVMLLSTLFLLFIDGALSKSWDLPEKTFLTGAQMLHEQVAPKTRFNIKSIEREARPIVENLNLKHYWNVQNLADKQRDKLMDVITKGKEKNLDARKIAKNLREDVFKKFSHKALLVSRTFVTEAEAKGRILYAEMLEKTTGKKQYLQANSAPDACPICKTNLNFIDNKGHIIEGKIFPIDYLKKQPNNLGLTPKQTVPSIPQHFNCRCIWLLTTENKYKEQQQKIKDGTLTKRKLDEVTNILKKHDKNFKKSILEVSLEKVFETHSI